MEFDNIEDIKELIKTIDKSKLMDFELKLQENVYIKMSKQKFKPNNTNSLDNISGLDSLENKSLVKDNINNNSFNTASISQNIVQQDINSSSNSNSNSNNQDEKQEAKETQADLKGEVIKSPIVGTFYASSSPDKPNFVNIGDKVKVGDVLCIVEAMKVMNEIKSNYSGEIAEVFANNEDMVEYNQELFRII